MRTLCAAAHVEPHKVFPHNFRHLFALSYYRMAKDVSKLADLLGHASIDTTRIYITAEECPGVWYVSTYGGGEQDGREFYVVARDAETIPDEAKAYGTAIPGCPQYLLYPMDAERQTRKIIQYEILRYRTREGASNEEREALREIALDGMEECPAYFGTFPPPETTPYGHTVRYKVLMNGAFWIQTDAPATALAVAYPIWDDAFSEYAMSLAEGDADGFGCLFFPERAICLAVFELGRTYRAMRECPLIDAAALMNAVCRDFPDYAVKYNLMEQTGGGVPLGQALSDANRPASPDWMISLTPGAGTAVVLTARLDCATSRCKRRYYPKVDCFLTIWRIFTRFFLTARDRL